MAASLLHIALLLSSSLSPTSSYHLPTASDLTNDARLDWPSAEQHCVSTYQQHLVSIHSASELDALRDAIHALGATIPTHSFWIGLRSPDTPSTSLQWSDSSPLDFGGDLSGGAYPWFDERPEQLSAPRHVRLWGGGASLLWDDTDGDNAYFWVCGGNATSAPSTLATAKPSMSPIGDVAVEQDDVLSYQGGGGGGSDDDGDDELLGEFWKFALIVLIVISSCILLLRVRSTWK